MSLFLTKQEQSRMAAAAMKRLAHEEPKMPTAWRDAQAVLELKAVRPTFPWEYPWAEVVRWCRDRRRT